jgi:hypothetical protein
MTSKAEEYCANAAECDRRAAATRYLALKPQFEELAHQWREMAKRAERIFR